MGQAEVLGYVNDHVRPRLNCQGEVGGWGRLLAGGSSRTQDESPLTTARSLLEVPLLEPALPEAPLLEAPLLETAHHDTRVFRGQPPWRG